MTVTPQGAAEPEQVRAKVRATALRARKATRGQGERIAVLTAYDMTTALWLDRAGVDVLLVGDSLGMVVQGHDSTLPVTVEDIIYHTRAVLRSQPRALVVADMPFMSFQVSLERTIENAGRLVKEGGAEAVKLEGGERVCASIRALVDAGVPVMGHLGMTPQSVHVFGGFRVQAKEEAEQRALIEDARRLEAAGVFAMVLEAIPADLAARVTEAVSVPTIGIGAGPHCDGQVLVVHDVLGLVPDFKPRFVKRYAELGEGMRRAAEAYVRDVRGGAFPAAEHGFGGRGPVLRVDDQTPKS